MRSTQAANQSFVIKLILTIYWIGALFYAAWYTISNWEGAPNGLLHILYALVRSVIWPVFVIQGG